MLKILILTSISFLSISCGENIKTKKFELPQDKWGLFFDKVLEAGIVKNPKAWANAVPKGQQTEVLAYYEAISKEKNFSLKSFIDSTFTIPKDYKNEIKETNPKLFFKKSFLALFKKGEDDGGSKIPTRYAYCSGGGVYDEFSYSNSFLVYKTLKAIGETKKCEELIINLAQFIQDYGYVPAGNRSYLMGHSELPVLAYIIEDFYGSNPKKLAEFSGALNKEYMYWMSISEKNEKTKTEFYKSLVFLGNNKTLNRFFTEDSTLNASNYFLEKGKTKAELNLERLAEMSNASTCALNANLYKLEIVLAKAYSALGKETYAKSFNSLAAQRAVLFKNTFWKDESLLEYDFNTKKHKDEISEDLPWVLLSGILSKKESDWVLEKIKNKPDKLSPKISFLDLLALEKNLNLEDFHKAKSSLENKYNNYEILNTNRVDVTLAFLCFIQN